MRKINLFMLIAVMTLYNPLSDRRGSLQRRAARRVPSERLQRQKLCAQGHQRAALRGRQHQNRLAELTRLSKNVSSLWHLHLRLTNSPLNGFETFVCAGKGIGYVLQELFQESLGMRQSVAHVLVLITDGKAQDDVLLPSKIARALGPFLKVFWSKVQQKKWFWVIPSKI